MSASAPTMRGSAVRGAARAAVRLAGRLRRDRSGVALLEFAFSVPLVLSVGMYGLETANLALVNMRVSQIALNLADNASRVGVGSSLNVVQLREVDMNDVLQAARLQGAGIGLTTNGRVIVSSLEYVQQSYDTAPVQRIHWQRCMGLKTGSMGVASGLKFDSNYGTTLPADGTDATQANDGTLQPGGMGDAGGAMVSAPSGSGVIFVEVNYVYQPLVSAYLVGGSARIHYIASFIVRDARDFTQIYNPGTATRQTCDKFTA